MAVVFHWSPDVCNHMSIEDLMLWHDKARQRSETKK
nr:GpE family phage tail protein [Moraxella sp. CTOTU47616]